MTKNIEKLVIQGKSWSKNHVNPLLYAYKVNPHVLDRLKLEDPYAPKLFRSKCRRRTELSSGLNFDLTELDPL